MRRKSPTLVCRLSMSLTTKTLEYVVPAYNLPRGRAVDRGKVARAQKTAQAEAPDAALAAQPSMAAVNSLNEKPGLNETLRSQRGIEPGAVPRRSDARRFPPPWSVEEQAACFVVKGQRAMVANHFL
jgi:hypothetical protein